MRYFLIVLLAFSLSAYASEKDTKTAQKKDTPKFQCEGKTKCAQMTSCDEARFYLTQCGVSRLDGDKDGTPCESICR